MEGGLQDEQLSGSPSGASAPRMRLTDTMTFVIKVERAVVRVAIMPHVQRAEEVREIEFTRA